jgi:hypothetical protein
MAKAETVGSADTKRPVPPWGIAVVTFRFAGLEAVAVLTEEKPYWRVRHPIKEVAKSLAQMLNARYDPAEGYGPASGSFGYATSAKVAEDFKGALSQRPVPPGEKGVVY